MMIYMIYDEAQVRSDDKSMIDPNDNHETTTVYGYINKSGSYHSYGHFAIGYRGNILGEYFHIPASASLRFSSRFCFFSSASALFASKSVPIFSSVCDKEEQECEIWDR